MREKIELNKSYIMIKETDIEITKVELEQLIKEKIEILKNLELIGKDSNYIRELSELALLQFTAEHYNESEENYILCLKYFKKQKDRLGQGANYGVLGTLYYKKEEYDNSVDHYRQALRIYRELHQIEEEITCLIGIGNSLIKQNKLDDASEIFLECASICSDNHDIIHLLDCLGNLIIIHEIQERWDVVFELYLKSLEAFKKLRDNQGIIITHFNLGILQKRRQKFAEALEYFKIGTNIAIDSNYVELIIRGLGYVAECLFYLGRIKDAKDQFVKALKIAKKINAKNAIIQLDILLKSLGLSKKDIEKELRDED